MADRTQSGYHCCITNNPRFKGIKQSPFPFVHDFVDQKFREGSDGQSSLVVSHEGAARYQLGLPAAEGLAGLDTQVFHLHGYG